MGENEGNVKDSRTILINYLINYLIREKKERRDNQRGNLCTRISPQIYQQFDMICRRLGLVKRGRTNVALEGLMAYFVEQYRDHPTIIQQTLTQLFVKAEPRSQVIIDLSQRLEIKLIKKDLNAVILSLESGRGNQSFFVDRLKELLPKAIRIYQKTSDPDLEKLLQKMEKWI